MEPDLQPQTFSDSLFETFSKEAEIDAQFEKTGDKNILFVTPTLTGENFYRIIMPFITLPDHAKVETAITGIESHNPSQLYEKKITHGLRSHRILWADTIVFPFTTQPLKETYEHIRSLNPQAKIIYNLDYNVFHLPAKDPLNLEINSDKLSDIDDNILFADLTLVDNTHLQEYLVQKHFSDSSKYAHAPETPGDIQVLPFLGNPVAMYNQREAVRNGPQTIRIGITVCESQYEQLEKFSKTLGGLEKLFPGKTEIIIIGGYKDDERFSKATKDFAFIHVPPCALDKYYNTLLESGIDIFLYLSKDTFFHKTSDDLKRIIDLNLLGIPVIINKYSPCSSYIANGQNGFVLQKTNHLTQLIEQILVTSPMILGKVSHGCFDSALRGFTYSNRMQVETMIKLFT